MFPIEASAIIHLLSYLKNVVNMNKHRWPKLVVEQALNLQNKTWMNKNRKWLGKWKINLHYFPHAKEEIKRWVLEKFRMTMWTKQVGKIKRILCQGI